MGKLAAGATVFVLPLVLVGACGGSAGDSPSVPASDAGLSDRTRLPAPIHVAGACPIVVDTPPLVPGSHVPVGTPITYSSNPPSSGPHYAVWAAYKTFATPIDRRYYVHNLEHGAIVFLYRCTTPDGCPDVVRGLEQAAAAVPDDPMCDPAVVRARTVITPDPLLDVPVAAVAWGWTYKAECIDAPSLKDFAIEHYGQGTERTCGNGSDRL